MSDEVLYKIFMKSPDEEPEREILPNETISNLPDFDEEMVEKKCWEYYISRIRRWANRFE